MWCKGESCSSETANGEESCKISCLLPACKVSFTFSHWLQYQKSVKEPKTIIKPAQLRKTACYQSVMLLSLISHTRPWGYGIQLAANHSGPNSKAQHFTLHTASSRGQHKTPEGWVRNSREWGQRRSQFYGSPHPPRCNASGSQWEMLQKLTTTTGPFPQAGPHPCSQIYILNSPVLGQTTSFGTPTSNILYLKHPILNFNLTLKPRICTLDNDISISKPAA